MAKNGTGKYGIESCKWRLIGTIGKTSKLPVTQSDKLLLWQRCFVLVRALTDGAAAIAGKFQSRTVAARGVDSASDNQDGARLFAKSSPW